jgi:hypothetical protein
MASSGVRLAGEKALWLAPASNAFVNELTVARRAEAGKVSAASYGNGQAAQRLKRQDLGFLLVRVRVRANAFAVRSLPIMRS